MKVALYEPAPIELLTDEELDDRYTRLLARCSRHAAERREWKRCINEVIKREYERMTLPDKRTFDQALADFAASKPSKDRSASS